MQRKWLATISIAMIGASQEMAEDPFAQSTVCYGALLVS